MTLKTIDSEVAEVLHRGRQDYSALSQTDQARWRAIVHSFFRNYENAYCQYQEGLIDGVPWESLSFALERQVAYPGVVQWWAEFKGAFGKPVKGTWQYVGGTGKYEGITGGGEFTRISGRPAKEGTFQSNNINTGTYKLP